MKKLYLFNRKTGGVIDFETHEEQDALELVGSLVDNGRFILPHFTLIRGEEIPLSLDDGKVVVKHEPQEIEFP